jgi:hypothetical protein
MRAITTTPALPGGREPFRARNAAIAARGIVSAAMVAAGYPGHMVEAKPVRWEYEAVSGSWQRTYAEIRRNG